MSGGRFEYNQHRIHEIAQEIEHILERQGTKLKNRWGEEDYEYVIHPPEIQQHFKDAIKALRIAYIYAQRIDWYLSGDDGEESFIRRLKEELKKVNNG